MNENCHLDYSQNPIATPFYFNVFYGSDCHVRCEIQVAFTLNGIPKIQLLRRE